MNLYRTESVSYINVAMKSSISRLAMNQIDVDFFLPDRKKANEPAPVKLTDEEIESLLIAQRSEKL